MSKKIKRRSKEEAEVIARAAMAVMMHFPELWQSDLEDEEFTKALCCSECADLRAHVCEGKGLHGWDVVKCMEQKRFDNWEFFGGRDAKA